MLFFATLFACFAIQDIGQDSKESSPTAESVIEKFIAAKGGESSLRKIKNVSIKGSVFSNDEKVGAFEIYQAANRHLSINRFPDGSSLRHGTDGKLAWEIDVKGKPTLLEGQRARDYIRHYETLHESLEWSKQFNVDPVCGQKNRTGHRIASFDICRARQSSDQSVFFNRVWVVNSRRAS